MLCFLFADERLHKGFKGTGPRQRGGAAECPQVSLSPQPFGAPSNSDVLRDQVLEHQAWPPACLHKFNLANNQLKTAPFFSDRRNRCRESNNFPKVTQQMTELEPNPGSWSPHRPGASLHIVPSCGEWRLSRRCFLSLPFPFPWLYLGTVGGFWKPWHSGFNLTQRIRVSRVGTQASTLCSFKSSLGDLLNPVLMPKYLAAVVHLGFSLLTADAPAASRPRILALNSLQRRHSYFLAMTHGQEFVDSSYLVNYSSAGLQPGRFQVLAVSFIFDFPESHSLLCV